MNLEIMENDEIKRPFRYRSIKFPVFYFSIFHVFMRKKWSLKDHAGTRRDASPASKLPLRERETE